MPKSFTSKEAKQERILITVKTYPLLSSTHTETVCTAGLREGGRWVRIYPVPFRALDKEKRFRKYQWIETTIAKDTRDPRPESYKLAGDIKACQYLDTRDAWQQRKQLVLGKVYHNLDTLIGEARDTDVFTSLAVFKPERIIRFHVERDTSIHSQKRKRKALARQMPEEQAKRLVQAVPFRFYYTFTDQMGKRSTLQILDWEIYQLCRKIISKYGARKDKVTEMLKAKYLDQLTQAREVYFFLGTNKYWHIRRSNNPFMIIGIFIHQDNAGKKHPGSFPPGMWMTRTARNCCKWGLRMRLFAAPSPPPRKYGPGGHGVIAAPSG